MNTDKVSVQGNAVMITTDSEATAREIAAAADAMRVKVEGTHAE